MLSATLQSNAVKISGSDFQADPAHPGQDFFILSGGEAERSGNRRAANPQFVQSELDDCRIGAKPAHHRNQRRFFLHFDGSGHVANDKRILDSGAQFGEQAATGVNAAFGAQLVC